MKIPPKLDLAAAHVLMEEVVLDDRVDEAELRELGRVAALAPASTAMARQTIGRFVSVARDAIQSAGPHRFLSWLTGAEVPRRIRMTSVDVTGVEAGVRTRETQAETFEKLAGQYEGAMVKPAGSTGVFKTPAPEALQAYLRFVADNAPIDEDEPLRPVREFLEAHYKKR